MKDNVNNDDTTTIATEPSAFTASTDMSKPNPYAGQPWLPNKTLGVPKAALNVWYMQKPRSFQCSKDQYICWSDGGRAHETKFTCVFVCPLSGEFVEGVSLRLDGLPRGGGAGVSGKDGGGL